MPNIAMGSTLADRHATPIGPVDHRFSILYLCTLCMNK